MKVILLKEVENIVAKGEIARFEQLVLLSQCFQKSSAAEASESVSVRRKVNLFPHTTKLTADETFIHIMANNKSCQQFLF